MAHGYGQYSVEAHNIAVSGGSQVFAGIQINGDSLRDRILRWLDPIDSKLVQDRLCMQRTPETGEAFLYAEFKEWLASSARLLWLRGEAGSGKTFLSSLIVERLPDLLLELDLDGNCQHSIAYFYCSFQNDATHEATCFLKSVNAQLLLMSKSVSSQIEEAFQKNQPFSASQNELCSAILSIVSDENRVAASLQQQNEQSTENCRSLTIVLDGLDEVPSGTLQNQYFSVLGDLAASQNPYLRIIVVSRPQPTIGNHLKRWKHLSRTVEAIERDIDLFALQHISQTTILQDHKNVIRHHLCQGKKGLFRLAALQMQEVCISTETYDTLDQETILQLLNSLPRELDPFYDQIVAKIPQSLRQSLEAALRWITFSSRPLYVEEVVEACNINCDDLGTPTTLGRRIVNVTTVAERLRGMIEVQPSPHAGLIRRDLPLGTYTFQFVHQTVKEYLFPTTDVSRPAGRLRFEATVAHKHLAQCCLMYLSHCARECDGRTPLYPLRSYSWHSWSIHFITSLKSSGTRAKLNVDSKLLQNSMILPQLYARTDTASRAFELHKQFDDFLFFLDPSHHAPLRGAIRDTSFPSNMAIEDWTEQTYRNAGATYAGYIRFIVLEPSKDFDSDIRCSLLEDSLENSPHYETLTWVWGHQDQHTRALVNGYHFVISQKIDRILRCIRLETTPRVIWIDTICINMRDEVERTHQVEMMPRIYGDAFQNVLYMGDENEYTRYAMREISDQPCSMQDIHTVETDTNAPHSRNMTDLWIEKGLDDILARPIWGRLWVVQEISAAKDIVCYCGVDSVSWDNLQNSLARYVLRVAESNRLGGFDYGMSTSGDWELFERIRVLRQRCKANEEIPLPEIIGLTRAHRVSYPYDRIYAVRSLLGTRERNEPLLRVDYSLTLGEVQSKLASYIISTYHNLDILSFAGSGQYIDRNFRVESSWVPNSFDGKPLSTGVFTPREPELYNAGGGRLRKFVISSDYLRLTVEGVFVDIVATTIPHETIFNNTAIQEPSYALFWEETFRHQGIDPGSLRQNLEASDDLEELCWRAACADAFRDRDSIIKRIPRVKSTTNSWPMRQDRPPQGSDHTFVVTERGFFGLTPPGTLQGDRIVVLFGAMVPFVLRLDRPEAKAKIVVEPNDHPDETHLLVGECFLHGIMDGEILRAHDAGTLESQMFRII